MDLDTFPEYVKIGDMCAVRLIHVHEHYAEYYRDCGAWTAMIMWNGGELIFFGFVNGPESDRCVCSPCTVEEYELDNRRYI